MSNPYGPDLKKLADWNALLVSCCCEMPECPAVEEEWEARSTTKNASLYPPFKQPAGATTDRPTLYENKDAVSATNHEAGQAEYYQGWDENPTIPNDWVESLQIMTFAVDGTPSVAVTGNTTTGDTGAHEFPTPFSDSASLFYGHFGGTPFFPDYEGGSDTTTEISPDQITVTATTWRDESAVTRYQLGSLGLALQGAGGADNLSTLVWDITYGYGYSGYDLTGSKPPAAFIGDATGDLTAEAWATTASKQSASSLTWPTIGDLTPWPAEADAWSIASEAVSASVTATRYRWTVPEAHEGTWFKVMWDIIEEPDGWDDPSPTVSRSWVSQDNEWTWEDPAATTSDWYEIAPPTTPGIRRVVNLRVFHHHAGPYGNLPTPVGEQVTTL